MRRRLQNWWTVNQQYYWQNTEQQYYWWEHVYKTAISNITDENISVEQYIGDITDERRFTKLNSISVILLMKTVWISNITDEKYTYYKRLQNWTVYQ